MKPATSFVCSVSLSRVPRFALAASLILAVACAAGCGMYMSPPILPTPQNTSVTVMVSSTANAQLAQFNVSFTALTLTSQSGKTITVFNTPQQAEFIHLNGTAEPLTSASIPQDVYTAATATVQFPQVTCVMLQANNGQIGGLLTDEFQSGTAPVVTLTLPSPIRITGTAMGFLLNLQVSQSVMPATCPLTQNNPVINTVFTVTPVTLVSQPASPQNGKLSSLQGFLSAVNSMNNSFTVAAADGPTWVVRSDNNTQYQGVAAFSTLAVGMPVDFDVAMQSDGSLLATRVEVEDANPSDLTLAGGPLLFVSSAAPALFTFGLEEQGFLFPGGKSFGALPFSFGNAAFQITGRLANLHNLPFAPSFTSTNIFAGQNAFLSSHAQNFQPEPIYAPASTVTLMPQTINGTITGTGTEGAFTTYTVSLASYDLIPQLAVQPGQTTILNNPGTVTVYVDSNTQLLNTEQLAVGSIVRFNGLLFNDNGTLRMDAAQVNDGVRE